MKLTEINDAADFLILVLFPLAVDKVLNDIMLSDYRWITHENVFAAGYKITLLSDDCPNCSHCWNAS